MERESTHYWSIFIIPFLNMNILNWGASHLRSATFFNSNIFIRIFIAGFEIVNGMSYKQIVENGIIIDRSEAEKYEFTHESWINS